MCAQTLAIFCRPQDEKGGLKSWQAVLKKKTWPLWYTYMVMNGLAIAITDGKESSFIPLFDGGEG